MDILNKEESEQLKELLKSDNPANWQVACQIIEGYKEIYHFSEAFLSFLAGILLFQVARRNEMKAAGIYEGYFLHIIYLSKPRLSKDVALLLKRIPIYESKFKYNLPRLYYKMKTLLEATDLDKAALGEAMQVGGISSYNNKWKIQFLLSNSLMTKQGFRDFFVYSYRSISQELLTVSDVKWASIRNHYWEGIKDLGQVTVSNNGLKELPPFILEQDKIGQLFILNNPIQKIASNKLVWPVLKRLGITKCRSFRTLDGSVLRSPYLDRLEINSCRLPEIPRAIFDVKSLTVLNLARNKIELVPKEITQLKNLTILNLNDNVHLNQLANEIGLLKNLRKLEFNNCALKTLPKSIEELEDLEVLRLASNQLTNFPEGIFQLKKLRTLCLSHNLFELTKTILDRLLELPLLEYLTLEGLPIQADLRVAYLPLLARKIETLSF